MNPRAFIMAGMYCMYHGATPPTPVYCSYFSYHYDKFSDKGNKRKGYSAHRSRLQSIMVGKSK